MSCCARRAARRVRRCERRRAFLAADDRRRGGCRRARDPRLPRRPRLRLRPSVLVTAAATLGAMPGGAAYFGVTNSGINLVINLLILLPGDRLATALDLLDARVDARRRIADPVLRLCAVIASLFPFIGTAVYMIVRPPEYLQDVQERELEMEAARGPDRLSSSLLPRLPTLRSGGREGLPDLPELPQPAARPLRELPPTDRADLERVPVLRDAGCRQRATITAPARGLRGRRAAARVAGSRTLGSSRRSVARIGVRGPAITLRDPPNKETARWSAR